MYEKDLRNEHVKQGNWDEAIEAYTWAKDNYSKEAIFYANRALCCLKQGQFNEVVTDCTLGIQFNDTSIFVIEVFKK